MKKVRDNNLRNNERHDLYILYADLKELRIMNYNAEKDIQKDREPILKYILKTL